VAGHSGISKHSCLLQRRRTLAGDARDPDLTRQNQKISKVNASRQSRLYGAAIPLFDPAPPAICG
jgi:hypothetical protein